MNDADSRELICPNCDAEMPASYCPRCGQRDASLDPTFREWMGDFLGELFTLDSRIFGSLMPLLFKPGFLTAEYIAGRRARYVPPFRMYLTVSLVLFAVLAIRGTPLVDIRTPENPTGSKGFLTLSSVPVDAKGKARPDTTAADSTVADSSAADSSAADSSAADSSAADFSDAGSIGALFGTLTDTAAENPERVNDEVRSAFPRLMFFLLPVFALILKVLYIRRRRLYFHHLIFALHLHSFVFLAWAIGAGIDGLNPARVVAIVQIVLVLGILLYLLWSMKRVYAQPIWKTVIKSGVLLLSYGMFMGFAFLILVLFNVSRW